jgi:hypothetical protein
MICGVERDDTRALDGGIRLALWKSGHAEMLWAEGVGVGGHVQQNRRIEDKNV